MRVNVSDLNVLSKLSKANNENKYLKYPKLFLSNKCKVIIENNCFFKKQTFYVTSTKKNLPRTIFLYVSNLRANEICTNYWTNTLVNNLEQGYLKKKERGIISLDTMQIGLSKQYLKKCNGDKWTKEKITEFIECLFYEADTVISKYRFIA